MKKILLPVILFAIPICSSLAQVEENHVWKVIEGDDGSKFWYDASSLDTIKGDKFNIWILETYKPPKTIEGVDGEIFRCKTLYCINLTTVKYGILKIKYYNVNNEELGSYDYNIPPPPESIQYTYPITEDSNLYYLLKELYGPNGVKSKKEN